MRPNQVTNNFFLTGCEVCTEKYRTEVFLHNVLVHIFLYFSVQTVETERAVYGILVFGLKIQIMYFFNKIFHTVNPLVF